MPRPSSGKPPKILIASLGTRGDVQPYAALAKALSGLGAEVVISTGTGFEAMIEAAGATARPVPVDYQALLGTEAVREALFTLKGKIRMARQGIGLERQLAAALWQIGLDEAPDLILFNLKASVMTLVARRLDVPALATCLQPVIAPTGDFPVPLFGLPAMGRSLNRAGYHLLRRLMQAGLAPVIKPLKQAAAAEMRQGGALIDGHMPSRMPGHDVAPSLQAFSSALVPTPADWPEHAWPCGYWFAGPGPDDVPPAGLPAFLADFLEAGPPPVYLGFGSMPSRDAGRLTGMVLEAIGRSPRRAILSTGWGGLTREALPKTLENRVFILDKAPHSWLFPRCAAIVHHGGAGTTHEALRWARPSLVCPVFGDQPFWGARVQAIGAGPEPIAQKHLSADRLAAALDQLDSPAYRDGAAAAARIMAAEPGATGTARRLMAFLGNGS